MTEAKLTKEDVIGWARWETHLGVGGLTGTTDSQYPVAAKIIRLARKIETCKSCLTYWGEGADCRNDEDFFELFGISKKFYLKYKDEIIYDRDDVFAWLKKFCDLYL
jgi:hypothetical protein